MLLFYPSECIVNFCYDAVSYDIHKLQITMLSIAFVEINIQSVLAAQCQLKMVIAYKSKL